MAERHRQYYHSLRNAVASSQPAPESRLTSKPIKPWSIPTDQTNDDDLSPDQLGNERYVRTLTRFIESFDQGVTIGLFGGYGAGKSWIVKRLTKTLNSSNKSIGVIEYGSVRTQCGSRKQVDLNTGFISVIKPTARSLESTIFR